MRVRKKSLKFAQASKSRCGRVMRFAWGPSASNLIFVFGFLYFSGFRENARIGQNCRNLRNSQSRGFERPRRSRSQHSTPGGAMCLSSASVAQVLAAASIKVMNALFGFLAQNDAQGTKRELLGRTWRRDWAMRKFQENSESEIFSRFREKIAGPRKFLGLDALGGGTRRPRTPARTT